jgi:hypothetical protein
MVWWSWRKTLGCCQSTLDQILRLFRRPTIVITKNGVFVEIQSFFLHSVTKKLNSFGPPEFALLSFIIITRLFSNNNVSSSPTETLNCSDKVEPRQGGYHPCWRPQNASPSNRKRRAPISSDYSNTHVDQKKNIVDSNRVGFFFFFRSSIIA